MADEVHFEIFRKATPRSGWTLHDISAKREDAIRLATTLTAGKQAAGAKVVKQAYDPKTSDFLSLTIFEAGARTLQLDPKAEEVPPFEPCAKPEDFYTLEARAVIARLLGDFLARQRLTVSEFIHRADALKVFETTTSVFQHAVQRIAVVQSAGTRKAVQDIIKGLNALLEQALLRVYHDEERGLFPDVAAGGFGALATAAAAKPDGAYIFGGALARALKSAGSFDSKVARLLTILDEAPRDEAGHTLLVTAVDGMIAEILNGSASLYELIGGRDNLNAILATLIALFLGSEQVSEAQQPGLAGLAARFADDQLPLARMAVISRILAELKSSKRLCPTAVAEEIKALRKVATSLTKGIGRHLDPEDLAAVFTLRSKRIVTRQALDEITANAVSPEDKLERLLFVLDNIVGAENKRQLASFIVPFVSGSAFESHFLAARPSPAAAIKRLADYQARVFGSGFNEQQSEDIASLLDRVAARVEERTGLFKGFEAKTPDTAERALFYLTLCNGGVTRGKLATRARKAALDNLAKPDFMAGFAARLAREAGGTAKDARSELTSLLEKAGIAPERVFNASNVMPAA